MTEQQMNVAIAEACGYKHDKSCRAPWCWWTPSDQLIRVEDLPDYCNDLNAMHEAEKFLTLEQAAKFQYSVFSITCRVPADVYLWHSTALQRAETFLRTIGKWVE